MNGLKKFFGKDDIQVFESGRKSAEQAKQKARKPKSSRWKKYLAVGASLAILGFATPLNSEDSNAYASSDNIKSNKIELASNVTVEKGSAVQDVQQEKPLTEAQKKELKEYDERQTLDFLSFSQNILNSGQIIINEDIINQRFNDQIDNHIDNYEKKYKKQLTEKEIEREKRKLKRKISENVKEETQDLISNIGFSHTGRILVETAVTSGWRISLMPEEIKNAREGASGTTDYDNKIIYIKTIEDRKAEILNKKLQTVFVERKKDNSAYEAMKEKPFKDRNNKTIKEIKDGYKEKLDSQLANEKLDDKLKETLKTNYTNKCLRLEDEELTKNAAAAQVWDMAHELRHAWQQANGIGLFINRVDPSQKANMSIEDMEKDKNSYNVKV